MSLLNTILSQLNLIQLNLKILLMIVLDRSVAQRLVTIAAIRCLLIKHFRPMKDRVHVADDSIYWWLVELWVHRARPRILNSVVLDALR